MTENDFLLLLDAVQSGTLDECPVASQLSSSAVVMLKGSPITFDEMSLASFLRQFVPGWFLEQPVSLPDPEPEIPEIPEEPEPEPEPVEPSLSPFDILNPDGITQRLLRVEEQAGNLQEIIDTLLGSEDE